MLLKIFLPAALIVLPILLPINSSYNGGSSIQGLDKLGWQNYDPAHTDRLWAHLILAVLLLLWTCYVIFEELSGYIRVRQAYLTSPQHRLRASATTVLVTSIPRKWLTYEALDGLFDVFPGGIRNIWINRNFDELNDKVQLRNKLAEMLEGAETDLIRNAKKKQMKMRAKQEKEAGTKHTKAEKKEMQKQQDRAAQQMAAGPGLSSGDPHQARTLEEALGEVDDTEPVQEEGTGKSVIPISFGRGVGAIGQGLKGFGQGFTKLGRSLVKDVTNAPKVMSERLDAVNHGGGLILDGVVDSQYDEMSRPTTTQKSERTMTEGPGLHEMSHERLVEAGASASKTETQKFASSAIDPRVDRSPPQVQVNRPSVESRKESLKGTKKGHMRIKTPDRIDWTQNVFLEPVPKRGWKIWKDSHGITLPSPQPYEKREDPLDAAVEKQSNEEGNSDDTVSKCKPTTMLRHLDGTATEEYPTAYDEKYADDKGFDTEPEWKKYLSQKDRDTTRLPLFGLFNWLPFMPSWTFIGKKVDTIYYCRREVARLNLEIEKDQQEPEKYPLMNSAFIQFNHQVAAHMACQSLSHHLPNHMTPRIVEIAPGDVIWDNLSVKWWERLLRLAIVIVIITGLVILWAIPVSFTSAISTLSTLATYKGFTWINKMPKWLETALSGILPPLLVNLLLALLPIFLSLAAKQEGAPTGMSVQLIVQDMYFAFSFVQLFLVVTISTSIVKVIGQIGNNPTSTVSILAENIPKASNYFFSYMILQALSVSAGNLAQIPTLVLWFLWRPIADSTARQKFQRQLNLPTVSWGTFFPAYTNLACIGLIYSIIAPLIMVFNIITWTLFWIVYRYQTLYVNAYKFDTGGLLFPRAVGQLFTGIYVMELALIGLFLLVRDAQNRLSCLPQAIIMIVMLVLTALYQVLINTTFKPLYRYMPITLEDDAVRRDEEFERIQAERWQIGPSPEKIDDREQNEDIESMLSRKQHEEDAENQRLEEQEAQDIAHRRHGSMALNHTQDGTSSHRGSSASLDPNARRPSTERNNRHHERKSPIRFSWAHRSRSRRASLTPDAPQTNVSHLEQIPLSSRRHHRLNSKMLTLNRNSDPESAGQPSALNSLLHTRTHNVGDALFGQFTDTIEDLTAAERDTLVQRAFQHEALRARRPVIWIPRDDFGVSDDEIRRTNAFCGENVWISNEFTSLDRKVRVMFGRAPPDFSEIDLIEL